MTHAQRRLVGLVCLGLGGALLGCHPTATNGSLTPRGAMPTEAGPFTGGKKVFVEVGCSRCHSVNGVRLVSAEAPAPGGPPGSGGGMMGPRGPDLGKVAQKPDRTLDWFMKYVRKPQAVDPKARMPAFGEQKIKDDDLRTLAEYLTTLK
ncbi:MAG TPA: c-type cytochrome [Gemmataceae bacterium]|nr:c-type cytochrome [Gemmataceae bacterium]